MINITDIQNNLPKNYSGTLNNNPAYMNIAQTILNPIILMLILINVSLGLSPLASPVGLLICRRNPQVNFNDYYPKQMTGAIIKIILEYFGFIKVPGQLKANSGSFSVSSKYEPTHNHSHSNFSITINTTTNIYNIPNIL